VLAAILEDSIMKRIFTLMVLSLLYHACVMDKIDVCQIKNNSTRTIQVNISFDKNFLDSTYREHNYGYITHSNGFAEDSGVTLINFDTLNLTLNYNILPKANFTLARGVWSPDIPEFKSITIMGKDTIKLNDKNEIYSAFKKIDGEYVLAIK
jgi:hypothetical protein